MMKIKQLWDGPENGKWRTKQGRLLFKINSKVNGKGFSCLRNSIKTK